MTKEKLLSIPYMIRREKFHIFLEAIYNINSFFQQKSCVCRMHLPEEISKLCRTFPSNCWAAQVRSGQDTKPSHSLSVQHRNRAAAAAKPSSSFVLFFYTLPHPLIVSDRKMAVACDWLQQVTHLPPFAWALHSALSVEPMTTAPPPPLSLSLSTVPKD